MSSQLTPHKAELRVLVWCRGSKGPACQLCVEIDTKMVLLREKILLLNLASRWERGKILLLARNGSSLFLGVRGGLYRLSLVAEAL